MNKVYLIGRIAHDFELKFFDNGKRCYIQFPLAINNYNKFTGEKVTDFIDIVAFDKKAEIINEYLSIGSQISIEGHIQIGSYMDKQQQKRYSTKIILESFKFMDKKNTV